MDHETVIASIGVKDLAAETGVSVNVASHWKLRGRIPAKHWSGVVSAATKKGLGGITTDVLLAGIHSSAPQQEGV